MNFKNKLRDCLQKEIIKIWPEVADKFLVEIEYPKEERFGDYSTNVCMKLAIILHKDPLEICNQLSSACQNISGIKKIEVARPGFLNFYLKENWLERKINVILREKRVLEKVNSEKEKKYK